MLRSRLRRRPGRPGESWETWSVEGRYGAIVGERSKNRTSTIEHKVEKGRNSRRPVLGRSDFGASPTHERQMDFKEAFTLFREWEIPRPEAPAGCQALDQRGYEQGGICRRKSRAQSTTLLHLPQGGNQMRVEHGKLAAERLTQGGVVDVEFPRMQDGRQSGTGCDLFKLRPDKGS